MTERPILMSVPMVRAILEGRKTQTRRLVKPQPAEGGEIQWSEHNPGWWIVHHDQSNTWSPLRCPYGEPGDRLWVREAWRVPKSLDHLNAKGIADAAAVAGWDKPWAPIRYEADGAMTSAEEWRGFGSTPGEAVPGRYRHARFMPRWACRIVLELTAVRVERLQEISQQDVFREGLHNAQQKEIERAAGKLLASFECYERLWDSLNAKRAPWASNPWVWVLEFRRT